MASTTVKRCNSCNGIVASTHTGNCPQCGENTTYRIAVGITDTIEIADIKPRRVLTTTTVTETPNKKAERIALLLMAISVIVAIVIPTPPFYQPFTILIAVFLSFIALAYTSPIIHTQTHKDSA